MTLTKEQTEYVKKLEAFLQTQKYSSSPVEVARIKAEIMLRCPTWEEFATVNGLHSSAHFATFMMGVEFGASSGNVPVKEHKH